MAVGLYACSDLNGKDEPYEVIACRIVELQDPAVFQNGHPPYQLGIACYLETPDPGWWVSPLVTKSASKSILEFERLSGSPRYPRLQLRSLLKRGQNYRFGEGGELHVKVSKNDPEVGCISLENKQQGLAFGYSNSRQPLY
jgi:hypothetical protein